MTRNQECGDKVLSDATAQEIDGGAGRAVVIDEVAPVASKAIETRACVIEDYAGGGIALGSKPTTNIASALASAEIGSHNEGTANGLATEVADHGVDVGGDTINSVDATAIGDQPPLPGNFDWLNLKPRRYGNCLPTLDPAERDGLKKSIATHGFFGKILIDEWLNIIEGNTRWEICRELDVRPEFEIVQGRSEEEKEELALSLNSDRRQLKDPEVELKVRQARLENLFKLREKDPKKWTQEKIADLLGISKATVSIREGERHKSNHGTVSKPDGRRKYSEEIEREAVRLVNEGMPRADVARKLVISVKAVERAEKADKSKNRKSGTVTAKQGKKAKSLVDSGAQQVTKVPDDGVPEFHQRVLEYLGRDAQAYAGWFKAAANQARQDSEAAANNAEKLLRSVLYCNQRAEADKFWLRKILANSGEGCAEEATPDDPCLNTDTYSIGDVHLASVLSVEPDGVYVALPGGVCGMIRNGDTNFAIYAPLEVGTVVRVRIKGVDSKSGLLDLQLLGRQSFTQVERTTSLVPDFDDRSDPSTELAGLKTGPEDKEVIR
jgi:DNA-binding XRE family transcriptional regulator